jgi:hypothetical protein
VNVSAVIVTRGDVDLSPVLDSLPRDWQKVIWNNSERDDLSVYGRYAAIEECEHDLIFTVDDDVALDPGSVEQFVEAWWRVPSWGSRNYVVCNMPQRFRDTGFYDDHALVGFGAIFRRDLPGATVARLDSFLYRQGRGLPESFHRTADIVFTALTPRILVDLPYTDLPWASAPNRMWKTDGHVAERTRMLELVRQVRDAG